MNPCPYCGLEDDCDPIAARFLPFDEGDILFCEGCGGMEIATGVLRETRVPTHDDVDDLLPIVTELRRAAAQQYRGKLLERPRRASAAAAWRVRRYRAGTTALTSS